MIYQKQDKLIKGLAKYYGQDLIDNKEALKKETHEKHEPMPSTKIKNVNS